MKLNRLQVAMWLAVTSVSTAAAGELSVIAKVTGEHIEQDFTLSQSGGIAAQTQQIRPQIGVQYDAKRLNINLNAEHIQQRFNNGTDTQSYDFTNASLSASWTVIERLLQITANVSQGYNSFNVNNLGRNLFLSPNRDLNKTQRYGVGFTSEWLTGSVFGGGITGDVTSSETQRDGDAVSKSDSHRLSLDLVNGDALPDLKWSLQATQTDSSGFNNRDFDTTYANLDASYRLFGKVGLALNASFDANEASLADTGNAQIRDFTSYGVGLSYSPSVERSLSLTWNTSQSDDPEADEEDYLVGAIDWAFSSRTRLNARTSKRFFGRTSSANFVYNLKHLRAVASRSEAVTSTSRLLNQGSIVTPFVCNAGASSINDCFLPETTDYTLGAGEQFINVSQPVFALVDSVIIRKSDSLALLYDRRKTTISLTFSQTSQDRLQQQNIIDADIIDFQLGYQVGSYTNISLEYSTQDYLQTLLSDASTSEGTFTEYGMTLSRDFGQSLNTELSLKRLDKEGTVTGFNSFGVFTDEDYTENRITFSLSYEEQ